MAQKKDSSKRKRILDASIEVFARKGFHNATVQDVAREAGVAHGTVYLYFKSKNELFISMFQETLKGLIDHVRCRIAEEKTPEDKLRKMLSFQVEVMATNPDITELMLVEFPQTGRFLNSGAIEKVGEYIDMIAEVFQEGVADGTFDNSMDADVVATIIYSALHGLATRWVLEEKQCHSAELADRIADVFLKGILSKQQ